MTKDRLAEIAKQLPHFDPRSGSPVATVSASGMEFLCMLVRELLEEVARLQDEVDEANARASSALDYIPSD